MNKKKIIIIAAVAVVLFILWKRGTFDSLIGKKEESSDDGSDIVITSNPMDDYNTIIERTTMPADVKAKVKNLAKSMVARAATKNLGSSNGKDIYTLEVQSAANYGITLTQQLVRSSINQLPGITNPATNQKWLTQAQANAYMEEVQSMG